MAEVRVPASCRCTQGSHKAHIRWLEACDMVSLPHIGAHFVTTYTNDVQCSVWIKHLRSKKTPKAQAELSGFIRSAGPALAPTLGLTCGAQYAGNELAQAEVGREVQVYQLLICHRRRLVAGQPAAQAQGFLKYQKCSKFASLFRATRMRTALMQQDAGAMPCLILMCTSACGKLTAAINSGRTSPRSRCARSCGRLRT